MGITGITLYVFVWKVIPVIPIFRSNSYNLIVIPQMSDVILGSSDLPLDFDFIH